MLNRGIALVVVSGLLCLLISVSVGILQVGALFGRGTSHLTDGVRLVLTRTSALEYAAARLAQDPFPLPDWTQANRGDDLVCRGEKLGTPLIRFLNPSYSHGPAWIEGVPQGMFGRTETGDAIRRADEKALSDRDVASGRLRGTAPRGGLRFLLNIAAFDGRVPVNAGVLDAADRVCRAAYRNGRIVMEAGSRNGIPDHRDLALGPNRDLSFEIDRLLGRIDPEEDPTEGKELIRRRPLQGHATEKGILAALLAGGFSGFQFVRLLPGITVLKRTVPQGGPWIACPAEFPGVLGDYSSGAAMGYFGITGGSSAFSVQARDDWAPSHITNAWADPRAWHPHVRALTLWRLGLERTLRALASNGEPPGSIVARMRTEIARARAGGATLPARDSLRDGPPCLFGIEAVALDGAGKEALATPPVEASLQLRHTLVLTSQEDFENLSGGRALDRIGVAAFGRGKRPVHESLERRYPHVVTLPVPNQDAFDGLPELKFYPRDPEGKLALAPLQAGPRGAAHYWPVLEDEPGGKGLRFFSETRPDDAGSAVGQFEAALRAGLGVQAPLAMTTALRSLEQEDLRSRLASPGGQFFSGVTVEGWCQGFELRQWVPDPFFLTDCRLSLAPGKSVPLPGWEGSLSWEMEALPGQPPRRVEGTFLAHAPEAPQGRSHLACVLAVSAGVTTLQVFLDGKPMDLESRLHVSGADAAGDPVPGPPVHQSGPEIRLEGALLNPGDLSFQFLAGKEMRLHWRAVPEEEVRSASDPGFFVPYGEYISPFYVFDRPATLVQVDWEEEVPASIREQVESPITVELWGYADERAETTAYRIILNPAEGPTVPPRIPVRGIAYRVFFDCRKAGRLAVSPEFRQIVVHFVSGDFPRWLRIECGDSGRTLARMAGFENPSVLARILEGASGEQPE